MGSIAMLIHLSSAAPVNEAPRTVPLARDPTEGDTRNSNSQVQEGRVEDDYSQIVRCPSVFGNDMKRHRVPLQQRDVVS